VETDKAGDETLWRHHRDSAERLLTHLHNYLQAWEHKSTLAQ